MKKLALALLTVGFLYLTVTSLNAQDPGKGDQMQDCPMHKQHMEENSHHAMVEKHGDQAMGFPHDKTTHHFRMVPDGGAIEVTVNDLDDKANTEAIRLHLSHIATMFRNGDFSTPAFVHDGVPPGVTTMEILKDKIQYQYEEIAAGGRVRIGSSDPIAVAAIHDFLRFQITDHQTGDTLSWSALIEQEWRIVCRKRLVSHADRRRRFEVWTGVLRKSKGREHISDCWGLPKLDKRVPGTFRSESVPTCLSSIILVTDLWRPEPRQPAKLPLLSY